MKNLFVFAIVTVALTIFNGCQKSDEPVLIDEQPQVAVKPDVYVENGYLVFKDYESYEKITNELDLMDDIQIDNWEKNIGFHSARSFICKVYEKLENINTLDGFYNLKKEYQDRLIFTEDNDILLPFYATAWESVLNPKGEMKIGHTLYKFDKDREIMIMNGTKEDLDNLSNIISDTSKVKVFYPTKNDLLKSVQWGTLMSGTEWNGSKMKLDWSYQLVSLYYYGTGYGSTYYTEKGFELKHWMRQKRKKWGWHYNKTKYYMRSMNLHIEFYRDYNNLWGWTNKYVYNQSIPDYTSSETKYGCTYRFLRYYDVVPGYQPQVNPEIYSNNFTFWSRGIDYNNRKTINYTNQ